MPFLTPRHLPIPVDLPDRSPSISVGGTTLAGAVPRVLGVVLLGVVDLGDVEQRGQGDLDGVERVLQKPVAPLAAAVQRVLSSQISRPQVPASSGRSTPGTQSACRCVVGGPVGRNALAGSFATSRATRRRPRGCCRCCPRARLPASTGLCPHMEAAHRGGAHDDDSSAPGRLVACQRRFGFGRLGTAAFRSTREIERFAGLSATAGSVAQTRNRLTEAGQKT